MPDATTLASQALTALNSQNYTSAISLYTQALNLAPTALDYYIKRSTAYQRNAQYSEALQDAEIAVVLGHQRGKREAIGNAQLRRAISMFMLERYGDSGFCFKLARKFNEGEKSIDMWVKRLEMTLEKVPEDDVRREVVVKEVPVGVDVPKVQQQQATEKKAEEVVVTTSPAPPAALAPAGPPTDTKPRHDWYETPTHVYITLFTKNINKAQTVIEIDSQSVSVEFPLADSSTFQWTIDPLYAPVDVGKSTYKVLTNKIELSLCKGTSVKWKALESVDLHLPAKGKEKAVEEKEGLKPTKTTAVKAAATAAPAYPTSSRTGPKNWDKLADELTKTKKPKDRKDHASGADNKDGEKEEEEEEDYDIDDTDGDPVNHFFKKLYKDADEDTRRAMMKSYVESNGTALSTNWAEVGKGKVETSPPDGLVAKKWDE